MATTHLPSLLSKWDVANQGLALPIVLSLTTSILFLLSSMKRSKDGVHDLGGLSLINAWTFFTKRYDFMRSGFKSCKRNLFGFYVLHRRVVAMSGTEARKVFFTEPSLNFTEGYRILFGATPRVENINVESVNNIEIFSKRLQTLLRRDRIESVLPSLMEDVDRRMRTWGDEGMINPFKELYNLVFQMTVRMASCRELADDITATEALHTHYWDLEKSSTPLSLLFPWFPGSAKRMKAKATRDLYMVLTGYVERRRNAKVPNMDAIDLLIETGDSNQRIVEVMMGFIFAGVVNTGMNVCWLLVYLGGNPIWKSRISTEIDNLIKTHTDPLSSEPLHRRLESIPMPAWEDSLPCVDLAIRETLRITMSNFTALRRNVKREGLELGSQSGDPGDKMRFGSGGEFLAYNMADIHLDGNVYTEPMKFDPDRYGPGREEDKKVPFAFLGWGVGRHPCLGMRVAKLEMKVILVMLLAGYDHELVDWARKPPTAIPEPDRNDMQKARPVGDPVFIKFKRRETG